MFDLEQVGQWFARLPFCLLNNFDSVVCNSHRTAAVLAGFVIGLLGVVFAGYLFYRNHRKYQRDRLRLLNREIAALEKSSEEQAGAGGEIAIRILARKYRDLLKKSGLSGWRIFGDKK